MRSIKKTRAARRPRSRDVRASTPTTAIRILGETWRVPRGFGRVYARAAKDDLAMVRRGKPGAMISSVIDLLALVGYAVTLKQVVDWDLRKRVEAVVYAATEYARASDNPVQRHPRPSWLTEDPWRGPERNIGVWRGPTPTLIGDR